MPSGNPSTSRSGTVEQSAPRDSSRRPSSLFRKAFPIASATKAWENADAIQYLTPDPSPHDPTLGKQARQEYGPCREELMSGWQETRTYSTNQENPVLFFGLLSTINHAPYDR